MLVAKELLFGLVALRAWMEVPLPLLVAKSPPFTRAYGRIPLANVGVAEKTICVNVPVVPPRLAPLKLTRAPWLRVPRLPKVRVAPTLKFVNTLMVDAPAPRFRVCTVSEEF